jgi:transcriptional regulator with XRE-family HTH domain
MNIGYHIENMPMSPALSEGLARYGVGETIRALRLKKKMGLVELGRHSGLSPALLSKLERGKLFPTLPTLLRIALVFSVGLEYFFAAGRERRTFGIVRKADRRRFPEGPDVKEPSYVFESLDFASVERRTNAYYVEFQPSKAPKIRTHVHAGGEFIYMLEGTLELTIGTETCTLEKEDSVYFDASRPHGYRREGSRPCRAVVVTSPV